jgi:hypothetical protein
MVIMNLSESLSLLKSKLDSIDVITEAKGHLDHPEDLIFLDGSQVANRAIQASIDTVKNPATVTIKWDGYPALIFGRGTNGKFSIMDKHMFNKKDGTGRNVYSPEMFVQYDIARGVNREGLHQLIQEIWPGLEKADKGKGYYWGDLLFSKPLDDQRGVYTFRANPNGITYTVDVNSDVGKFLTNKTAGIVVHQFIPPAAATTDEASPLPGTIGSLKNNSDVAIVPAKMPITPKLKMNADLVRAAKQSVREYGKQIDEFFGKAPQAKGPFTMLFTTYINKKIVSGNLNDLVDGFLAYISTKTMSEGLRTKLLGYDTVDPKTNKEVHVPGYLDGNKSVLTALFTVWSNLYNLKMNIVEQLNKAAETSPVKGFLQDGTQTQEGFVSNGLKFVDRMGFSRQNLAGQR